MVTSACWASCPYAWSLFMPPSETCWKWLLAWMLIAWLFSLGSVGGLRVVVYYVLPVLRYMRHSALFRVFWLMGGAILTGAVIDRLLSASDEERCRVVSLALRIIAVILAACVCVGLWIVIVPKHGDSSGGLLGTGIQVGIATAYLVVFLLYRNMRVTRSMCACLVAADSCPGFISAFFRRQGFGVRGRERCGHSCRA